MKYTLILVCLLTTVLHSQNDPRVQTNRYEPVETIALFIDIYKAAYNTGNRDYIESMIHPSAVGIEGEGKKIVLLPPHYNTHVIIKEVIEDKDHLRDRLRDNPNILDHLPKGIEPFGIIRITVDTRNAHGEGFKTYYRELVVKTKEGLFFGRFSYDETKGF